MQMQTWSILSFFDAPPVASTRPVLPTQQRMNTNAKPTTVTTNVDKDYIVLNTTAY